MDGIMAKEEQTVTQDPRTALVQWANKSDEWIRRIVRQVLGSDSQITQSERTLIYQLFLEEKCLNVRALPAEPPIAHSAQPVRQPAPFQLRYISDVKGVNALVGGEQIKFGSGLTLLFGENGTGKTGYVRIFKGLAGSRSADVILSDVNLMEDPPSPFAEIGYCLGEKEFSHQWNGELAQAPFDRISLFDSPSVKLHVDENLKLHIQPGLSIRLLRNHSRSAGNNQVNRGRA